MNWYRYVIVATLVAGMSCWLSAAEPAYVAGANQLLSDEAVDQQITAGELLLSELNCVSCHAVSTDLATHLAAKPAPILTTATSRLQPDYIRQMLAGPATVKPGTTMPHLLHGVEERVAAETIESLLHYLVSVGGLPRQELPMIGTARRGHELFHRVGCAACHGAQQEGAAREPGTTPLGDVAGKYTLPGLTDFLLDPLHVRPGGRMPSLNLSAEEAQAIAASLLKLPEVARMKYAYYEGNWNRLPDFSSLEPVQSGGADKISVEVAQQREHFALRFEAYLRIDEPGTYRFYLGSDDGSRLRIDDQTVIENNDVHPYSEKSGDANLDTGWHAVEVLYFEQAGDERLTLEFEGPGISRQPLDARLTAERSSASYDSAPLQLQVDPSRVEQGRNSFSTLGCAACHELEENKQRVTSQMRATQALADVNPARGCLSHESPAGVPRYELSKAQRQAMTRALAKLRQPTTPTRTQSIHRTLAQFQCYACHQRGEHGGVTEARNEWFVTTTPEMGDEGRIPPPLTGVGGKLTRAYLEAILAGGAEDRPYMLTRMPRFGAANVGHLAPLLEQEDALSPLDAITFPQPPAEVKEAGRAMVGEDGFSCIKCHTFGRFPAQGIQSINLQSMAGRLRPEWFRRYMRNPQEFRPGTRMPSAWPPSGKSLLDQFFEGEVEHQIEAIRLYLADAERARIPSGLIIPSMELVPIEEAIIYRNFIAGAGPRAIAVGYPENIHLAFDANDMRIALLWQGRFIDASRHWTGRGDGFQPPAGEKVLPLPPGPPLAPLNQVEQSWPAGSARQAGFRFRGYHLTSDQRPTFRYTYAGVEIEDFVNTKYLGQGDPVPRTLTFTAREPLENLWFRSAVGRIQPLEDGWYMIDDRWRLHVETAAEPVVRASNGESELLVPVRFKDGSAQILLKYSW